MNSSIRKIIAGKNISNCLYYVKGTEYTLGRDKYKLSEIIPNEKDPDSLDFYLTDGESQFLWKTIAPRMILEVEYDVNFE